MELREMLDFYGFPGDDTPFIKGSALKALKGESGEFGTERIGELIGACDSFIPEPSRYFQRHFFKQIFQRNHVLVF